MEPVGGSPFDRLPDELLQNIFERRLWDAGDLQMSKARERILLELVCKRFQALVRSSPSLEWDVIGHWRKSSFRSYMLARTTTSLQKVSLLVKNVPRLLADLEKIVSQSEETLEEVHLFIASSGTSCADYEKLFTMLQACPKLAVLEIVLSQAKVKLDFSGLCKPFHSLRYLLLVGFRVYKSALGSLLETFPLLRNQTFEKMDEFQEPSWSKFFWWDSKSGVTQPVAPVPRTPRLVLMMAEREPSTDALDELKGLMVGCRVARVTSNLPGYLEVLAAFMVHNESVERYAGHTLYHIVNDDVARKVLTKVRKVVEAVMEIVSDGDRNPGAQLIALQILGLLACDGQSKDATAAFFQRVDVLVSRLEKGSVDEVFDAFWYFDRLEEDTRIRRMIARVPSFVRALGFCVACRPEVKPQEQGALLLKKLVEDERCLQDVASVPECLQGLLSVLTSGSKDMLETAAAVLCNLASDPKAREVIFAGVPEALPRLVSLSKDRRERVRNAAANALQNCALDPEIGRAIMRSPGGADAMAKLQARSNRVENPFYKYRKRQCGRGSYITVYEER